jgi:hypothetical protein
VKTYRQFRFESYSFDQEKRRLELHYGLDDALHFTETFSFGFPLADQQDAAALDRACFGLFMMAGVSYYKTYLPTEIVVEQGGLTKAQADFFDTLYRHGLGEFYVRNQLTPPERIGFPVDPAAQATAQSAADLAVSDLSGALVPLGGGKDSLVSVELLRQAELPFATWTVSHSDLLAPLIERVGSVHLPVERQIDPQLLELNQQDAYNGHVPISAILAFAAVISALLSGKQDIVMSNEASAGEINLEYHGLQVNHQYSKTLAFERDFQDYVRTNITPSVHYFSLLRPFSELRIAELFTGHWLEKYRGVFTSCNRNFKQGNAHPLHWCGECPKCAFVFLIFAPFIPKAQLIDLFGGQNLFTKPDLEHTYKELLGIQGHKPFECVGEIKECREAVVMARATGDYPELAQFEFPAFKYDYKQLQSHAMPTELYDSIIRQYA